MNKLPIYLNYQKAFLKLQQFLAEPILTERDMAGVIQAFEYTFEQAWKVMQKIAVQNGFEVKSPRKALEVGMSMSLIKTGDEDDWLSMLEDRNNTSHNYQEALAKEVFERISKIYFPLLEDLLKKIQQ